jgi:hypothetical protein
VLASREDALAQRARPRRDPRARLRLVRELVDGATDDFWPYWQ